MFWGSWQGIPAWEQRAACHRSIEFRDATRIYRNPDITFTIPECLTDTRHMKQEFLSEQPERNLFKTMDFTPTYMNALRRCIPVFFVILTVTLVLTAGCTNTGNTGSTPGNVAAQGGNTAAIDGPNHCHSIEECAAYCSANHEVCDQFCREKPGVCSGFTPTQHPTAYGPMAGTACDYPAIRQKMGAVIARTIVNQPLSTPPLNWMTKILPAGNPYPGYYYDLSVAFGPAIDAQKGIAWSGEGAPPVAPGLDYYTVGFWEEVPKGNGGRMGEATPDSIDLSHYQLAIFYTNVTGASQAAMINALPNLAMSEAEAKAFFASKINRSFINLDNKVLTRSGNNKMYEVIWHDSDNTQDYWDVQIGTGYIAIGQGKVYTAESQLAGDPGTVWRYHACKPCANCNDWAVENSFAKDCTKNSDCLGGLSCQAGYCIKPIPGLVTTSGTTGGAPGGSQQGKGPGSSCSSAGDCDAGLSCTGGVCSVPGGKP